MIHHLDNLLRHLFLDRIDELSDDDQVRFQAPDEAWRTHVSNLEGNALNVYLADLRENRRLRSNRRERTVEGGVVREEPAPARLDCHYLISAWSPAQPGLAVEPELDEHRLLFQAGAVLLGSAPLNPARIYPPNSPALAAIPAAMREADLPTEVLPPEGFGKLADFWSGMGGGSRWRPALYLVVTLPVTLPVPAFAGPLVTAHVVRYRRPDEAALVDEQIQVGGRVLDAREEPVRPIAGVLVRLERPDGRRLQMVESGPEGQFTFGGLRAGDYRLRARPEDLGELVRDVAVPPAAGAPADYDLRFEPS